LRGDAATVLDFVALGPILLRSIERAPIAERGPCK
jgi:hypothetical protein